MQAFITEKQVSQHSLPECPSSPNCVRKTYITKKNLHIVQQAVLSTLEKMGAHAIEQNTGHATLRAVFCIVIFKDDVTIQLEENAGATLLHIRSASRTGTYDFGVNNRRVNKFIKLLEQQF